MRAGGQAGVAAGSERYVSPHLGPSGTPPPRPISPRSPFPFEPQGGDTRLSGFCHCWACCGRAAYSHLCPPVSTCAHLPASAGRPGPAGRPLGGRWEGAPGTCVWGHSRRPGGSASGGAPGWRLVSVKRGLPLPCFGRRFGGVRASVPWVSQGDAGRTRARLASCFSVSQSRRPRIDTLCSAEALALPGGFRGVNTGVFPHPTPPLAGQGVSEKRNFRVRPVSDLWFGRL